MKRIFAILGTSLLSILPLFAQTTPATEPPAGKDYSFTIPANGNWLDTKVDLDKGDAVQISPASAGCTTQASTTSGTLPLASIPAGSVIVRLAQSATPLPVGSSGEIDVDQAGHLYLGLNGPCPASVAVKVHVGPAGAWHDRGQQLKQQLDAAAAIFAQGQFGDEGGSVAGKLFGESAASAISTTTTPLKVSDAPLDAGLRKDIDGLPRRVNDQFKNLGDMVNFVLVGSESQVKSALDAASWHIADTSDTGAVMAALKDTYQKDDYLAMPMSTLYLFNRPQDYGYEMAEPIAMVASRHHFRIWKAPFTWDGQTVWAGAGTHDIGFAKDKRNGSVTHKIDPNLDGERTNIGQSLDKAGKAKSMSYYLPPNPVQTAKNATGDGYTSDGKILVVFLK
jgi:hypothetical protein